MYSIRRSCQSALRNPNGVVACSNGSRRAFSRTVARSKGGLPVFLEPSSTELTTLLATINSKVLLPEHLTRDQQRLVYSQKSRAKLESEPVEVTVGDVTLPLEPLDHTSRPNQWRSLKDVMDESETTADWENVVRLVEGYHSAGIALKPEAEGLVVRRLIDNGHQNLVLKALQRVKASGLRLSNYRVTLKVLKGAHDRAAESGWDLEETLMARRFARQVVELMEDEEHHAILNKRAKTTQADWRSKPYVIAVPTELEAVVAQKEGGSIEVVKTLATRLVHALKQESAAAKPLASTKLVPTQDHSLIERVAALSTKTEADFKALPQQTNALNECCETIFELVVVLNALHKSKAVLGANMPLAAEAAELEATLKTALNQGMESMQRLQKRGGTELRSGYPMYIKEQVQKCQL